MNKYIDADKLWNRLISVSENEWVGFDTIDEVLSGMPAADVQEVRHGRWIHKDPSGTSCSKCGSLFPMFMGLYDYCPNCGASMVNEDEEMSKVSEMEMAYGEYLND